MQLLCKARFILLTFCLTFCHHHGNARRPSCNGGGNSLSGTLDEMALNISVQDVDGRDCSVNGEDSINIKSCLESSRYSWCTQMRKDAECHEQNNGDYSSTGSGNFNYFNATCLLLFTKEQEEKLFKFQCTWPKEYSWEDDSLPFKVTENMEKEKCKNMMEEADKYLSELKITILPNELFKTNYRARCDLETTIPMRPVEQKACNVSMYLNVRKYEVRLGENLTISCHRNNRTIHWVAIGRDNKVMNPLINTTVNGILEYLPKTGSENDFIVMCFHEEHKEQFIIGFGVVKHKQTASNTTSKPNSDGVVHVNITAAEVTNMQKILTTTSPSGNNNERNINGQRGVNGPRKLQPKIIEVIHAGIEDSTNVNPRLKVTEKSPILNDKGDGKIRKIMIVILILALTFSISTCLIAVSWRVHGKCVSSRQTCKGQDGQIPEETSLSEGEQMQSTHLSMRMLPRLPPEQSVTVVEERSPEQNTSPCVCWSPEAILYSPNVKSKCGVVDKGPAAELDENTESYQSNDNNNDDGQSLKSQTDCNMSVASDNIYQTLDDLENGYEQFSGRCDQDVPSRSSITSSNQEKNSTGKSESGPSQSEYLETRPQRCLDDLYAKPLKLNKSEVTDSTYSKLQRPAVEKCHKDAASITQDQNSSNTAPEISEAMGDSKLQEMSSSENCEMSLDELFEPQNYQLLENVKSEINDGQPGMLR